MGRLLDALLILDVERACRVSELALRVGLPEQRLRDLLSSYMVAGADGVGTAARCHRRQTDVSGRSADSAFRTPSTSSRINGVMRGPR